MAWFSENWKEDLSIFYGYPMPKKVMNPPKEPNISNFKHPWSFNNAFYGYPMPKHVADPPKEPNISNFKYPWNFNNAFYGYPNAYKSTKSDSKTNETNYHVIYKIYYNDELFYRSDMPLDIFTLVDATLALKANSAGSLECSMAPNNKLYDSIKRMKGLVKVTKNDRIIWEGRVLEESSDFWKNNTLYCEGILACLNDTHHPQLKYENKTLRQYMEALLSIHNQKVDKSKQFQIGIVTANDNSDIGTRTTSYESTWDLFKALVDEYGGYLFVRYDGSKRYIDFRKDCPRTSSQKIEFGVNLMDFTRNYDMSSLCTVLLPLGKVIANAGSSAIGAVIDSRLADGYYIDPNTYNIYYDSGIAGAYHGSNGYFTVEAGKTYYITCRNHGGRVLWALKDSSGNLVNSYTARTDEGFTDLIEYKLEVPPSDTGNNYQLAIAGFGSDIQPRVNDSVEAEEEFDKYTTIEEVNNGSIYISNKEAVTNYGWIEKQLTWNNIEDPSELKRVAETYLKDGQFDEMTLEVSAVDLQMMGIKSDYIDILDEVWVVSEPHGLNKTFPVTELTIDLCNPSANKFTLGSKTEQTLSGVMADANDEIFTKINAIPTQSATLISARENATMLINNAVSGIFMLEYNDEGINTGFRISNVPDWDTDGAKGWRFNMGGIGYFGNGFDKPVTLALTGEDGGIVANCITAGEMLATRIRGGVLGLGHWQMDDGSYLDGQLQIADSNGNIIVDMNKNGAFIEGEIKSTGKYGSYSSAARVVDIKNGWITGGTNSTGKISVDTLFNYQGSEVRGTSIEGDIISLVSKEIWYGPNANELKNGLTDTIRIGNVELTFSRGGLVGVNYVTNTITDDYTFETTDGRTIYLQFDYGILKYAEWQ